MKLPPHNQPIISVAALHAANRETRVRAFRLGRGHNGRKQQYFWHSLPPSETPPRSSVHRTEAAVPPNVRLKGVSF